LSKLFKCWETLEHYLFVCKLLKAFNALLYNSHSIILIEHHPDIIKCADYAIDLSPEGGKGGGMVVFEGTPEELAVCKTSATAASIAENVLKKAKA
jgi:excinuclease ABC subunit A